MAKVHPSAPSMEVEEPPSSGTETVLTVWRKSLLFNCSGFTVFDAEGNLVFRVDNYSSGSRSEVVLMDAIGKPILTSRRKKLSLRGQWRVYDGETKVNPRFSAKKRVGIRHTKALARVASCSNAAISAAYEVEGSYLQRCCSVYSEGRRQVLAEVRPKEATHAGVGFGADVFRLVVQPGFDVKDAMAIVILLEQMFGSSVY